MITVGIASPQKPLPFPYLGKEKPRPMSVSHAAPAHQGELGALTPEISPETPATELAEAVTPVGSTEPARAKSGRPAALLKRTPKAIMPLVVPTRTGSTPKDAGSAAGPKSSNAPTTPAKPEGADLPKIAKGDVVLAPETEGYFEAVVLEVRPDDQVVLQWRDWPDEPVITKSLNQCSPLPEVTTTSPRWADIKAGSVVVANLAPKEGWFEAVVIEMLPGGRVDLRWQGEPDDPMFARARDELALLPVGYMAKGVAK